MPSFSVNHMTMANACVGELLDVASGLNCVGVELRTDLPGVFFGDGSAEDCAKSAQSKDLRILALSEVSAFNDLSDSKLEQAESLMKLARGCGAEAISLIPRNDGQFTEQSVRIDHLKQALLALQPLLKSYDLIGLIEPLGFEESSLRYKGEVVQVIESLNFQQYFKIVHDTFHHHLANEQAFYPEHTGIVHISGVVDSELAVVQMRDHHRVLVDEFDRLDNIGQIKHLIDGGYTGPFSYEAFSPDIHNLADPKNALFGSFNHITSSLC